MSTSTSSPAGTAGERPAPAESPHRTPAEPPHPSSWWAGRSGLVVPAVTAAFSTYLLVGAITMEIPDGTDFPGPAFYPLLLVVAGYVLSALLALHYLRTPETPEELSDRSWRTHSDWTAVVWCAGGFLVFALTLEFLGWILAAALLFWAVTRGFGSRRPLFDLTLALFVSSAIYLAFSVGLDLTLPSGVLGGGF